jgi:hypothetical protein
MEERIMPKEDEALEPTMHIRLVAPSGTPVQTNGHNGIVPAGRIQISNVSGVEHNSKRYNGSKRTIATLVERLLHLLYG